MWELTVNIVFTALQSSCSKHTLSCSVGMLLIFIQTVLLMLKGFFNSFHVCFHVFLSLFLFLSTSLAVHPDKITIATGQVAGTSSDGKVSEVFY